MSTRYRAAWVLPVTAPPILDGAVLVDRDGRIAEVGSDAAVPRGPGVHQVDLGDAILLPGLVNVHAHPELHGMRGLLEDRSFDAWLPALMRAKRGAYADDWLDAARWCVAESLAAGITTLAATEDSGASQDALLEAGMRGVVYREVFGPAPEDADRAVAELERKVAAMRERETDMVRVGVSPHAPYTVSLALFANVATFAAAESLPVAVHTSESRAEYELVARSEGPFAEGLRKRGIQPPGGARTTIDLLERLALLGPRTLLIHCVQVDTEDIARIAASGAAVAHCPIANARLGHGIAPVTEMLEASITVAIGTDSVASNNRMDLLEEARAAQLMQRARQGSPSALPGDVLLRMATLDGARALGMEERIGSIEPGKDADLMAVSLEALHVRPVHDPVAALFYAARATDVTLAMVRGRVLYRSGEHLTMDMPALRARVDALAARLAEARDGP